MKATEKTPTPIAAPPSGYPVQIDGVAFTVMTPLPGGGGEFGRALQEPVCTDIFGEPVSDSKKPERR